MSYSARRYIREKENYELRRGYSDLELQASELRKKFVQRHIVDFDTYSYKTQQERDWGYICKREFRYDVTMTSLAYGFFWSNLVCMWRTYMTKKMVWWPIPVVTFLGYLYWRPIFFQKHNKKLFDMCNVGEQYYLGKKRNEVLRECNRILDREDF